MATKVTSTAINTFVHDSETGNMAGVCSFAENYAFALTARNADGKTALTAAAGAGHVNIVKYLLAQGFDVNDEDHNTNTALRAAAQDGRTEVTELLLRHGAAVNTINKYKMTALSHAAWAGHMPVVRLLLKAGADTDIANRDGRTAAVLAREWFHFEVAELIEHAAAVQFRKETEQRQEDSVRDDAERQIKHLRTVSSRLKLRMRKA